METTGQGSGFGVKHEAEKKRTHELETSEPWAIHKDRPRAR